MPDSSEQPDPGSLTGRYAPQVLYENMGPEAQRLLARRRAVLVGCGAMGGMQANILVRAGVGHLRIVDRDVVELDNLQRQVLFDEQDVAARTPKAEAARVKLARINSAVTVEAEVAEVGRSNIERLIHGADLLLDGTDNFETRYLMNDAAVKYDVPWICGGVVADHGTVLPILPGQTPCLRCLFPELPEPDELPTSQTDGVLASAVAVVAALQTVEAIKILTGQFEPARNKRVTVDVWTAQLEAIDAGPPQRLEDCPCCSLRKYEFLTGGGPA